jgi:hypothetical protein
MFHMRQRWGAAVLRAQTQVLLGRLKYALPGWEEAESATEASWRSHASGSGDDGYQLGCWVRRRRGSRRQAVDRLGERRRLRAVCEGQARGFWGARCAAWPVVNPPPKKEKVILVQPKCVLMRAKRGRHVLLWRLPDLLSIWRV